MKKTSKPTAASRKPSRRPPRLRRSGARLPHVHALVELADFARRAKLRWYVFGAQAVNLHGFPRATADLDVTIDLGDRPVLQLLSLLAKAGFEPRFTDAALVAATRVIPVVHRASGLPIDLVLAGPGLEQRFLDEVVLQTIERRRIPILSIENLIVTKLLAGRSKDLEDVRELLAVRGDQLHYAQIEELLSLLEQALDQRDLRPLLDRLRDEVSAVRPTTTHGPRKRTPRR